MFQLLGAILTAAFGSIHSLIPTPLIYTENKSVNFATANEIATF